VQAAGNVAASAVAGLLYTVASPAVAFGYLVAWMVLALAILGWAAGPTAGWTDSANRSGAGQAQRQSAGGL
jgi:hypothetical protein